MSGWQGRVVSFEQEHGTVMIAFDSITLRNMPDAYIETCEEQGLDWPEYGASPDELEVVPPRDTPQDVEDAIAELTARYAYSYLGEEGREMHAILAGVDLEDSLAVMRRWGEYLRKTLNCPFNAKVGETSFRRGPIRHGERLTVLGINSVDDSYGVLVDVKRGRESFVYPSAISKPWTCARPITIHSSSMLSGLPTSRETRNIRRETRALDDRLARQNVGGSLAGSQLFVRAARASLRASIRVVSLTGEGEKPACR